MDIPIIASRCMTTKKKTPQEILPVDILANGNWRYIVQAMIEAKFDYVHVPSPRARGFVSCVTDQLGISLANKPN